MADATVLVLIRSSLFAKVHDLVRADTGAAITAGVTVTCSVYDPDDLVTPLGTATLAHTTDGDWEGVISEITTLVAGNRVDVFWQVDGGVSLKHTWWARGVKVLEDFPTIS